MHTATEHVSDEGICDGKMLCVCVCVSMLAVVFWFYPAFCLYFARCGLLSPAIYKKGEQ